MLEQKGKKMTSEFGTGFIYCLMLFAKHRFYMHENLLKMEKLDISPYYLWFTNACDHLIDLEIPETLKDKKLGRKISKWQDLAMQYRFGFSMKITDKQFDKFWDQFEDICMEIDKTFGIKPKKAEWN